MDGGTVFQKKSNIVATSLHSNSVATSLHSNSVAISLHSNSAATSHQFCCHFISLQFNCHPTVFAQALHHPEVAALDIALRWCISHMTNFVMFAMLLMHRPSRILVSTAAVPLHYACECMCLLLVLLCNLKLIRWHPIRCRASPGQSQDLMKSLSIGFESVELEFIEACVRRWRPKANPREPKQIEKANKL